MNTSSVWARVKTRWASWHRYEYPEVHRQPRSNTTNTSSTLDPEEWMMPHSIRDHPLHQTSFDKLQVQLTKAAQYCMWTVVHGAVIYVFFVHVKPRLVRYFHNYHIKDDDDDDDKTTPGWKKHWKKRLYKKRLCCCCDAMVSSGDNYCPKCGSPTCPLCVHCGAGIQNHDHFCKACGRPVPDQVIVDGRPPPQVPPSQRSSSGSIGNNNPRTIIATISQQAGLPPPLDDIDMGTTDPPKEHVTSAAAESVPLVQADGFVPLVPAMYVEEVTAIPAPTDCVNNDDAPPLQFATAPSSQAQPQSNPQQQSIIQPPVDQITEEQRENQQVQAQVQSDLANGEGSKQSSKQQ